MRWLGGIISSMDMSLRELWELRTGKWRSEGQGSLVCCSPWGHKELDTTEWLNNNIALNPLTNSHFTSFFISLDHVSALLTGPLHMVSSLIYSPCCLHTCFLKALLLFFVQVLLNLPQMVCTRYILHINTWISTPVNKYEFLPHIIFLFLMPSVSDMYNIYSALCHIRLYYIGTDRRFISN